MSLSQVDLRIEYNHPHAARFNPETRCMSEMYWSFLKEYDTGKVKKCTIQVSDQWGDKLNHYTNWADNKIINLDFDFKHYFGLGDEERKEKLLEAIHQGMLIIAQKKGWQIDPLLDAYAQCKEKGLVYTYYAGKSKTSPDRKHKVNFWCHWGLDKFELFWVLYDKADTEIRHRKFLTVPPTKGEFAYYIKWKWLDPETVLLEDAYKYGKRESWEIHPFQS